jgi:hypothetical protein
MGTSMKTRTQFTHRLDTWGDASQAIIEHLAGVEDFEVAEANLSGGCESDGRKPSPPLVALAVVAALGRGLALSQGDLVACAMTIVEAIRRSR